MSKQESEITYNEFRQLAIDANKNNRSASKEYDEKKILDNMSDLARSFRSSRSAAPTNMIMSKQDQGLTYNEFCQLAIDAKKNNRSVFQEYDEKMILNNMSDLARSFTSFRSGKYEQKRTKSADGSSIDLAQSWKRQGLIKPHRKAVKS